jgi:hypothetical protein
MWFHKVLLPATAGKVLSLGSRTDQTGVSFAAIMPAGLWPINRILAGMEALRLSSGTNLRGDIADVPSVIPKIFQGRPFGVAIRATYVDGARQGLLDIRVFRGADAPMPRD